MSNLNALFSTNSKASRSRASANRSSGSSIQSFESDNSITPLSSVSNVRARSDDKMAEKVLRKTNNDFFLSLSDQWDGYFEKKMKKATIKVSIFKIFDKLPPINSNATAAKITTWKRSPIVLECYKKLFTKIENTSEKYIVHIIKNAWPKKEFIPDSHTVWYDNGDDDDDYNNNNNNNNYNNDNYNNNNNDYNDYNNNNVNNEDDFQIIEDDRRFTNN
ncbi:hypothetical protein Glove_52g118 [Diversispora epigaea]|uniref:Uncharacterized protein n=1 Tax=Diversispora epigaea TaxID=1348612 RepID=A0A397JFG1_9GLOM|nr:hypothetical protein Glove_52g118 [Diversispora epigaea]